MPMCRMENSTREWLGSTVHVPEGIAISRVVSIALIVQLLPDEIYLSYQAS
jgi:hypothetical protein